MRGRYSAILIDVESLEQTVKRTSINVVKIIRVTDRSPRRD